MVRLSLDLESLRSLKRPGRHACSCARTWSWASMGPGGKFKKSVTSGGKSKNFFSWKPPSPSLKRTAVLTRPSKIHHLTMVSMAKAPKNYGFPSSESPGFQGSVFFSGDMLVSGRVTAWRIHWVETIQAGKSPNFLEKNMKKWKK